MTGAVSLREERSYRRLHAGFLFVFWGGVAVFVLGYGLVTVPYFQARSWPFFFAGFLPVAWGLGLIARALPVPGLGRLARRASVLALLCAYFAPFYHWWRFFPFHAYLLANMIACLFCVIALLVYLNRLMLEMATRMEDAYWKRHAGWSFWQVVVFMLLPAVLFLIAAAYQYLRFQDNAYFIFRQMLLRLPLWSFALFLFPLATSLSACWYAQALMQKEALVAEGVGETRCGKADTRDSSPLFR